MSKQAALVRIRTLLMLSTHLNSRMGAAAIGLHLQNIGLEACDQEHVAAAIGSVRDASLAFLVSLHGRGDARRCRVAAIKSLDYLEAVILLAEAPEGEISWSVAA